MCFLPTQHGCCGRPGTSDLCCADPTTHLLTGTVPPLYHCLFFGCLGFLVIVFLNFSFSPALTTFPQGLSWSQPCPSTLPQRNLWLSLSRPWTSFQMTLLKWESPGKSSHFPSNGSASLWKIPQPWFLVTGRIGTRSMLGWCLIFRASIGFFWVS